jgi:ketosteroid isomerase-like protein
MSEENVETLRAVFDCFARGDKPTWRELTHRDIEVVPVGDWPEAEIRGQDAVWDFLVAADEPWEPGVYDLEEVTESGDHLAARMRRNLRGKSSGIEVEYDYWVVVTFREGKMLRAEWFSDRAQALEAAGLREAGRSQVALYTAAALTTSPPRPRLLPTRTVTGSGNVLRTLPARAAHTLDWTLLRLDRGGRPHSCRPSRAATVWLNGC